MARVPNVKVDGYFAETNEVFEEIGCFEMDDSACPINTNPSTRLRNNYRTDMRKLAVLQKIEKVSYNVDTIWGVCLNIVERKLWP